MTEWTYKILHDDQWIVVADKPAGLPTQPARGGGPSLQTLLAADVGAALFVIHRIDQPVSGAVLFARDPATAADLSALLAGGHIVRRYWAVAGNEPTLPEGTLSHNLLHDRGRNIARVVTEGGKSAALHYRIIGRSDRYWLIEVELISGRHHQIRAQFAAIGCPVRGDLKYGAKRSLPGGGIDLHARSVELEHPRTGKRLTVIAPAPKRQPWTALIDSIRRQGPPEQSDSGSQKSTSTTGSSAELNQ